MKFTSKDCFEGGFLRKIPSSVKMAEDSAKKAEEWLKEAEKNLKGEAHLSVVLSSYNSMFHVSKAVLFKDGIREKNHLCVARYLEDYYVKKGKLEEKWIKLLDHYRELRHQDQYAVSFVATKEDAERAISSSKDFFQRISKLV